MNRWVFVTLFINKNPKTNNVLIQMVSIHHFKMKIPLISENLEMMERDLQKFQTFRVFPKYFSNLFITQYNNQLTYFTSKFNGIEVHLVLYGQVRSVSERPNWRDKPVSVRQ